MMWIGLLPVNWLIKEREMDVWCEVVCNNCSVASEGRFVSSGRIPVREMKKDAIKKHNFHYKDGEMYCDRCFNNVGEDYDVP